MSRTVTTSVGNISQPIAVSASNVITARGNGVVEYTKNSIADIKNGTAVFHSWPSVTQIDGSQVNVALREMLMRVTADAEPITIEVDESSPVPDILDDDWLSREFIGNAITAESFGVSSNASAEFNGNALRQAFAAASRAGAPCLVTLLTKGTYEVDYIDFNGTDDVSTGAGRVRFVGPGVDGGVEITAGLSSYPCFITNGGGPIRSGLIEGLLFTGNSLNVGQMGVCFLAEPSSGGDYTGGWWNLTLRNLRFSGFDGPQVVFKGGQESSAGDLPNQFITIDDLVAMRPASSPWPSVMVLGQCGQAIARNLIAEPSGNQPGQGVYLGSHFARTRPTVSSVDTTGNYFTTSTHYLFDGQPFRLIGDLSGFVSTPQMAKDTTYYARPILKSAATSFHQNRIQAATTYDGSAIDISNGGTPANYSIVTMWTTAAPVANEFTAPFCHLFSTTDEIQMHGSNLPSGLSTGTTYWVIRTGPKTFKLASSKANARAGTAIAVSGGTPADWGIQAFPTSGTPYQPFSFMFVLLTSQRQTYGIFAADCQNIHVNPYMETLKIAAVLWGCRKFTMSHGRLASAGSDGGNGMICWSQGSNTRSVIDEDSLDFLGTNDAGRYCTINGPSQMTIKNSEKQSVAYSATPSVSLRAGREITVGALTGNITSFTLTDNPISGEEVAMFFTQDATGGRTVALGSSFVGPSISSGTANQQCAVWAKYNGTKWMYTFSTWG